MINEHEIVRFRVDIVSKARISNSDFPRLALHDLFWKISQLISLIKLYFYKRLFASYFYSFVLFCFHFYFHFHALTKYFLCKYIKTLNRIYIYIYIIYIYIYIYIILVLSMYFVPCTDKESSISVRTHLTINCGFFCLMAYQPSRVINCQSHPCWRAVVVLIALKPAGFGH